MKLNFCPTFGGKLYYLGDDSDDNAPMLKLEFCTRELGGDLSNSVREGIAARTLAFALAAIQEAYSIQEENTLPEPSKPLSEAGVRFVNSVLNCHVDESKFLRDYDEGI